MYKIGNLININFSLNNNGNRRTKFSEKNKNN